MKLVKLICLITMVAYSTVSAQKIDEWRGIGRTGHYPDKGLLQQWQPGVPPQLWSIEGIGKGYSSVTVADTIVYVTGILDSLDVLTALDLNGKIKWQTPYGKAWDNTYADSRCTPTVEDHRVYLVSGLGYVTCIDGRTGKTVWSVNAFQTFEGSSGRWGIAESPLIVDDMVIYTPGGAVTTVVALNKYTGQTIWTSESIGDVSGYVSPVLINHKGVRQIVTATGKYIIGVSPENGQIIWKFDYASMHKQQQGINNTTNTPIYHNGDIFITSGYDHAALMLQLADDAKSVTLKWTNDTIDCHIGGAVLVDGYIYASNWQDNRLGRWVCADWNTGKTMYEKDWINKGSIIFADKRLYCYEEKSGNVALVEPNHTDFTILGSFPITKGAGPHWAHPAIANGILYIRHGEALMAYDVRQK